MTYKDEYPGQVAAATAFLRERLTTQPVVGIILGTGLGRVIDHMDVRDTISYDDIPNFPVSTVESHHGRLLVGTVNGVEVLAMQGRFHLYEGYSAKTATFPVRVMGELGIRRLLVTNAAGGMNPNFRRGDLMMITDHINLQHDNPLIGPNHAAWGPRFPDMSAPYDAAFCTLIEHKALDLKVRLQQGVYVAVVGPNMETRAEYRFLRTIGADVVGMSTVPEVIAARHMGIRCAAISVITDECFPDALEEVSLEDVLAAADEAEPKLTQIITEVLPEIALA